MRRRQVRTHRQQVRMQQRLVRKLQQQVQMLQRLVLQELRLLLSCRKQPVQQRQRLLPKRGTCSFLRSLMIFKKTISGNCQKKPKPEFKLFLTGERTRALSTQL